MTPDQQLSILSWQNQPVRFVKDNGNTYVPVVDIANAIGVHKRALLQTLDRNTDAFSSHERGVILNTPGGMQHTRCLDKMGTYGLVFKISTKSVKDKEARKKIIEFNEWAMVQLGGIKTESNEPDYDAILNKIKFVNALHDLTKWNLLELQKEVLREAGMLSLTYHIEPEQKALPAPAKPKGYLTATDIGERIGKSAHEVYMFLYQQKPPLVVKDQKDEWRLTEAGKEYGEEECREISGGFFVWRIHWKKSILEKMNVVGSER